MSALDQTLAVTLSLGDEDKPVATTKVTRPLKGEAVVTVYESLVHPGCLIVEIDGDFTNGNDDLRVVVNDRYPRIFTQEV